MPTSLAARKCACEALTHTDNSAPFVLIKKIECTQEDKSRPIPVIPAKIPTGLTGNKILVVLGQDPDGIRQDNYAVSRIHSICLCTHIGPPSDHSRNLPLMTFPSRGWARLPNRCQTDNNFQNFTILVRAPCTF